MRCAPVFATAFAVALCLASLPADGQECADYAATARYVGAVPLAPAPAACVTDGERLYTLGNGTLTVLSLADPDAPAPLGALGGLGAVADLAVSGDRALLARGATGLTVVDLSDPAAPVETGTLALPAAVAAVGFAGSHVAAAGGGFFWLVDATTPSAMTVVGQTATIAAVDLAIVNDCALVTGQAGIASIALANPAAPAQVGLFRDDVGGFSEAGMYPEFGRLAVDGNRALVKSAQWDVYYDPMGGEMPYLAPFVALLDVSDPQAPANVGGRFASVADVALAGDVAALTSADHLLQLWSGEDAAFRGQVRATLTLSGLALAGGRAYVAAGSGGVGVFDVAHAGTVLPLLTFGPGRAHDGTGRYDLAEILTWSGHASSLYYDLYDLSDPLHPTIRLSGSMSGWMETPSIGLAAADGDLVCLGRWDGVGPFTLALYDMAFSPPRVAGVPYWNAAIQLAGDVAWVTDDNLVLRALDCSALPALPQLGEVSLGEGTALVGPAAGCVYAWSPPYTLRALDVSDLTAPRLGGSVTLPASVTRARAVEGTRAYLVCADGSLQIVELADPDHPALVGSVPVGVASPWALRRDGDLLGVAGEDGFRLVDIADPAAPVAISPVVGVPDLFGGLVLADGFAYAGHNDGLDVYDVSDAAAPALVGHGSGSGGVARPGLGCIVQGGAILPLACDSAVPVWDPPGDDRDTPRADGPALAAAPNPFNPRTTVTFTLASAGAVDVSVFDLRGARLRTLASGRWTVGTHAVEWDGRDAHGAALASGSYLVRLAIEGAAPRAVKVTLAR